MFKLRLALATFAVSFSVGIIHAATLPNGVVYSANEGDGSISEITLRTGDVRTTQITVVPHNVQISPDGKVILAVGTSKPESGGHDEHGGADHHGEGGVLILDVNQMDNAPDLLPSGEHPAHIVTNPDGRYAYITNADSDRVSVVDIQNKEIAAEIPTGAYPHGLRLGPDGRELYVANVADNSVSVINTESLTEEVRIPVGKAPVQLAFTSDGEQVYVSLRDENSVAIIDVTDRKVINRISVGRGPIQLFAAAGKMYVANEGTEAEPDNTVSVIDIKSQSILETVVTGNGAHGVVASDDGNFVFVTNTTDNTVSAINTNSQSVVATYSVGPNPNGITYRSAP